MLPAAKRPLDFKTGKLIDVGTEDRLVDGTSYRFAIFTVQIEDIVYVAKGDRLGPASAARPLVPIPSVTSLIHPADSGQELIIGDPIQAAVDGENLILIRPKDGKQIKAMITKRTRATAQ
jgi:hypothetical protein